MKDLDKKNCEFCGHIACLRCCHKQQKFQPKSGQVEAVKGLACRICDRKLIHRDLVKPEMEQIVYLNQWDINEEEHKLFGTKKEIAAAEEDLD